MAWKRTNHAGSKDEQELPRLLPKPNYECMGCAWECYDAKEPVHCPKCRSTRFWKTRRMRETGAEELTAALLRIRREAGDVENALARLRVTYRMAIITRHIQASVDKALGMLLTTGGQTAATYSKRRKKRLAEMAEKLRNGNGG